MNHTTKPPLASCRASHPSFLHRWPHWRCPACGGELAVSLKAKDADPACPCVHSDDQFACARCNLLCYGNTLARLLATAGVNDPCRDCLGRGIRADGKPCRRCAGRGYTPHRKPQSEKGDKKPSLQHATP